MKSRFFAFSSIFDDVVFCLLPRVLKVAERSPTVFEDFEFFTSRVLGDFETFPPTVSFFLPGGQPHPQPLLFGCISGQSVGRVGRVGGVGRVGRVGRVPGVGSVVGGMAFRVTAAATFLFFMLANTL